MGIVMKYGGTSVGSIEKIDRIAQYISSIKQEEEIVIVVSAMGKSTDELVRLAKELNENVSKREIDMLLATGEQKSIALLTIALSKYNVDAISLTGFQAGFITTSSHTKGIIKDIDIKRVQNHLKENKVVVVAGFQGITTKGEITTLGRGGSDTSAVALAAKLGYRCEIYTDVDGIYTTDPNLYPDAKKLDEISFEELMEMSSLGASVIETRSAELAKKYGVQLYVARSLSEKGSGTMIMNKADLFEAKPITGVSVMDDVIMVLLECENAKLENVATIFEVVSSKNINLDMISQNVDKSNNLVVSFSILEEDEQNLIECITENPKLFKPYKV